MTPSSQNLRRVLPLAALVFLWFGHGTARAAAPEPTAAAATGTAGAHGEAASPESPRACVLAYLEQARQGNWAQAATHLDIPPEQASEGPVLARRLKAVLDRHVWIEPEDISPLPEGRRDDGLPPNTEELARIPGASGVKEPVRLTRREEPEGSRWVFSRATVGRIDAWYGTLNDRWMLENLPEPLLRPGPRDLLWWQWLALPILFLVCFGVGIVLAWLTSGILGRIASRTETSLDEEILGRLRRPLALAWALVVFAIPVSALELYAPAERFVTGFRRGGLLVVVFWAALRTVDVIQQAVTDSEWIRQHPSARSLVPLSSRVGKVLLVALAAVSFIAALGYPVASLLAGLGLGGLAFALAAQKTVENLFGSFSIGVDQPFREGDMIKVAGVFGSVEQIGLRSTRIRTLDRTVVSIPNGSLADLQVETLAARDRLRLAATIGLVYETTSAQMRQVLEGLEAALRRHPKIWPDAVTVAFTEFGDSSLNVLVMAWFQTTDWGEFLKIRQDMLIEFMEVVEKAGSGFAFPTRTLHLVPPPGGLLSPGAVS